MKSIENKSKFKISVGDRFKAKNSPLSPGDMLTIIKISTCQRARCDTGTEECQNKFMVSYVYDDDDPHTRCYALVIKGLGMENS